LAEISPLQHKLDCANKSIDDVMDRLEDVGLGMVELTRRLKDVWAKIHVLEVQWGRGRRG
jgi:hypothetical protein